MTWNYVDVARNRLRAGDRESAVLAAVLAYEPGMDCPFVERDLIDGWHHGAEMRQRVDAARAAAHTAVMAAPPRGWVPRGGRTHADHTAETGHEFDL